MAEQERFEFEIQGMTCDSCAKHVEQALRESEGVEQVRVPGWESGRADVVVRRGADHQALAQAVEAAGYKARLRSRRSLEEQPGDRGADQDFDLMVIGGGSAGFAAAIKGAELGHRVAIVEAGTIGGTCVNVGCVPSKALIRAMEHYHAAGDHRFRGVETSRGALNWGQVVAQKDELVAELRRSKYQDVLAAYLEINYIQGRARLKGGNGVEIDGQPYKPGKIIIATGARPWAPPIPGLAGSGYLDSTAALDLKELPRSMIVLGANAVGLELAQIYARAGTFVTVLELMPRIAPFEDEAISQALQEALQAEGLQVVPGFQTAQVEKREGRYRVVGAEDGAERVFEAEQLLVATGRRPNTADMRLEQGGVELGPRGEILVDETLRSTNPQIYAAGDVMGKDMFVYTAAYGGALAAENALTGAGKVYDARAIPRVTFTDPQVASAGLTEAQAREAGYEVAASTLPMSYVPRALAARDTRGLIKLVADTATDLLLGAHILAPEAGEMIQVASLALRFGLTLSQLRETLFPYLTNVEGLKLAALAFEKDLSKLSCCAG